MTCSKLAGEQRQGIVVVALHFRIGGSVDEISIKPKTTDERERGKKCRQLYRGRQGDACIVRPTNRM